MATKTKHDLLLEKIRRRYEGTQTTNNKLNESLSTQVIQNQNTLPYNDDTWSWQKNYLNISRVANNFAEGFLGSFEGLLDLGTGIVGSGLEAIGLDDASKSVHDFGARNLSDELLKSDFNKYLAYGTAGWLSGVGIDEFHESTFGDQERLPSIVGDLATGAGNLVGMIIGSKGLGSIGKAGSAAQKAGQYGAIIGMSGGKSYEQALNEGASGYEATAYGVASGVTELASELVVGKLMSKIGLGTGKVLGAFGGEAPKAVNPNSSALGTAVKGIMKNFTEEGAEEVFSDLANPLLQKLTYKQEENIMKVYGDALGNTPEEVASSLAETFIVGGILGGASAGIQTTAGAKRLGSLEGYNLSQEVSALEEVNEDLKKAIARNNPQEIEELQAKKQSIQEALAIKYEKFLKDVESGRISKDELMKRIADDKLDNQLAVQLNRQGVANTYNEQVNRDLRKELSNEVAKLGFKGNIRVDIGEVQQKADGSYERLQGSYYDEKLKRVVLKSSQVKYNKLAEVLGHEFKHILESKELTELLLSDLSEADYKRMYKETYKAYSTLDEFNKLDEAKKEQYIREEMTADILGGYFSNLNQMARAFKKMDAKGLSKAYYNIRQLFDEAPRKYKNYNKVMELLEQSRAEYLAKNPNAESAESPRYNIDAEPRIIKLDDEFDGSRGYKIALENDEYKIKGTDWYDSLIEKRDDIEQKYDNEEISEAVYERRLDSLNDKVQEEIDNLESLLQSLEDYDLESMDDYETIPTPKQLEKIMNYAYNIQILVESEFPNVTVDFSSYLDEESKINELYNYLLQPKPTNTEVNDDGKQQEVIDSGRQMQSVQDNSVQTRNTGDETQSEGSSEEVLRGQGLSTSSGGTIEESRDESNTIHPASTSNLKSEQQKKIDSAFQEILDKYGLPVEDSLTEISELFDEEQLNTLEEIFDFLVNGKVVDGDRANKGLESFYKTINNPSTRTEANTITSTVENILEQLNEVFEMIDSNSYKWMKDGDLTSISNAVKLIEDLYSITTNVYDSIGDKTENIFTKIRKSDAENNFVSLTQIIDAFSIDEIICKLEGAEQAIKNSQVRKKSVNVNRGAEAVAYGNEARTLPTSTKIQGIQGAVSLAETEVAEREEQAKKAREEAEKKKATEQTTEAQPQTNEVEPETENSVETVATNTKIEKVVAVQIKTVIIQNTRYKSPKDNAKTLRWGAELYNKKVYTKNADAKPLLERISNYLHRQYKQNLIVKGKGNEMLKHQIIEVMDSIDKNFTEEQRINAVFELIKEYIPEYKKSIKTTVMKYIREQFQKGGKESKMVKLVEATTEYARNRYAKELDEAYKSLQEALDMVDVYTKSVEELKTKVEGLDTQNEEHAKEAKELKKTINSLEKEIKKLEAKNDTQKQKLEELKKTVTPLKQEIAKKESEISSLKKKVKRTSTAKATVQSALSGQKVINSKFRKGLDAIKFDELVDDGFKVEAKEVDDSLYNKITFAVSNNNIDGAVEKYLNFVGEFVVTKPDGTKTKLNDGSPEWNEFAEQIKQFFQEFYYEAPTSPTQNLKDELAKQEVLMKGVVSLIKSSYAIKRKLNKKMGVAQPLNKLAKFIVKGIGNPSITNLRNGQYREIIKEAYKQLTTKVDGENMMEKMGFIFDPAILDMMNQIGNNATGEMTSKEIEDMINIVKYISKFLTKSVGGRVHDGMTDRERVIEAIKQQKKLGQNRKWYKFLNALSPRVVFEYMDAFQEGINTYIYNKMLEGEITEQGNYLKLNNILNEFYEETEAGKLVKKELGKKVTINVKGYGSITATTGQFISIWKLLKRKDSRTHIANSGFSFTEKSLLKSEVKEYHFNKEQLDAFESAVKAHFQFDVESSPYEQYIKKLTKFFEEAKRMKIETDRLTKGFTNVIENEEYFPIKVVAHDRLLQLGENNDFMSLAMQGSRNYSFNASVEGLKGILEVSSVDSVVNVYSTQMARYSGYAETIDMVNTLFNYQLQEGDLSQGLYKGETLRNVMGKQYGYNKNTGQSNVLSYYNKLFKDVQGIRSNNDSWFEKLRKRFATFQLGANLKVMANQFSALPTALRYVSSKNLTLAWLNVGKVKVKDMPISAQYRMTKNQVVTAQTLTQQVEGAANFFGKGMEFTDNLVLKVIWSACLLETNNDVTKATKLFDDIHRETQGFNTLERSALLRSENSLIKSMMMFTIQPSHNLSNIAEMFLHMSASKQTGAKMSKADIKKYRNSVIGIAIEGAMYTAIGLLFKFLLGRDEDDEYEIESILESYINDNIIGMIPFLNSFGIDFKKGITMNDFNVGAISQLYEAFEEVQNIFDEDSNPEAKFKSFTYALGMVSGVPTRNMNNYGTMILKFICPDVAYDWEIKSSGASLYNKEAVNTALDQNKSKKAWNYYKAYTDNIVSVDEKTAKVMFDLYADGYRDAYIKQIPIIVEGIDENVVIDKEQFKKTYSEVSMALKKLTSSPYFTQLSDIKKEKLIKKVVNYYYEVAVKEQNGKPLKTMEILVKEGYCPTRTLIYLNEINDIRETRTMTRKEAVFKYINKLPISRAEKFLIYYLAGYTVPKDKQILVKNFLRSKGLSTKSLKELFE